jgi:ATP-dependent Clp protease ATP-binding subunit ClpC
MEENIKEENVNVVNSEELDELMDFIYNSLSEELPTLTIDLNYFLLGVLMQKDNDLYKRLNACMISSSIKAIYNNFYEVVSSKALSAVKPNRVAVIDSKLSDIFRQGVNEAKDMGSDEVTSEHIFLAILGDKDENNKIRKLFNKAGITYGVMRSKILSGKPVELEDVGFVDVDGKRMKVVKATSSDPKAVMNAVNELTGSAQSEEKTEFPSMKKKSDKNPYLTQYCQNLNELAEKGRIDPLIGRDYEIGEIIRILGRKRKNNAILVGGEGVGKTVICENLALKIVNGDVPSFLAGKEVVSLDMTALMAGTTLRGMFEERVKGIMDEIKDNKKFILFMDNIGAILADTGKGEYEFSSMISRSLENGEIQVIGTSDFASYRKTFDKDPGLARRFQKIIVESPSIDDSIKILDGIKPSYEEFHKVKYSEDAIEACVKLSDRYISERNLPDSAIDVMDEVGSFVGTANEPNIFKELKQSIKECEALIKKYKAEKNYEKVDECESALIAKKKEYNARKSEHEKNKTENPTVITKSDILDTISKKTGIPVSNLSSDDKKKLVGMNERLKENVIGQDDAIDTICKALKRNRIGLHKNGCMYSAMEIGKTGVGKTLIAKKLAKELFGNEDALVRFDMSEFSDKVAVNKLIGSNPGYVGYEEGGQLTETIKNKKHCVLLLDEIEKADPEIYNIFLQVLDEGFLTDNSGQKVDFKNVIVLFTSNVGARAANDFGRGVGFGAKEDDNTKRILFKELKHRFPPEFLNRIDDVIYFNALTNDNLKKIIEIEIGKLNDNLLSIGYSMTVEDNVIDYVLDLINEESDFGARPIIRAIQDNIENVITDLILDGNCENGHVFKISCDESGINAE